LFNPVVHKSAIFQFPCPQFERLVRQYAAPAEGSPAIAAADPADMPADEILGQPRGKQPTVGAVEVR
jgi:hypothetical protein